MEAAIRGQVRIETSRDPVGAPIFYRDVPLDAIRNREGRHQAPPLGRHPHHRLASALPDEPGGRLVLEGLHTCANCHSFSRDGKTLGMDVDGPVNDKGTYAIAPVAPQHDHPQRGCHDLEFLPG